MSIMTSLYAAVTGMDAQQNRIGAISNNLANINTTGFKSDRAAFEDLMYEQVSTPGSSDASGNVKPVGVQLGTGTKLLAIYKDFKQGDFAQTNRELDIAIEGNGFIQVTQDSGVLGYTRDGNLKVNQDGQIVDSHGFAIEPTLSIPADATSITIARDGTVSATTAAGGAPTELGRLSLVSFNNPAGLQSMGQNIYQETPASGSPTTGNPGESGMGSLLQGFLENSNVNIAQELIDMIVAQRSYESNSKVLTTANDMMRTANNAV